MCVIERHAETEKTHRETRRDRKHTERQREKKKKKKKREDNTRNLHPLLRRGACKVIAEKVLAGIERALDGEERENVNVSVELLLGRVALYGRDAHLREPKALCGFLNVLLQRCAAEDLVLTKSVRWNAIRR